MTPGTTATTTDNLLLAAPAVAIEAGGKSKRPRISIVAYSGGVMRVPGQPAGHRRHRRRRPSG